MQIQSTGPALLSTNPPKTSGSSAGGSEPRSAERYLQSVFTTILEQVGKEGYASASPTTASKESLESELKSSWQQWFQEVGSLRYHYVAGSESPSVRPGKNDVDLRDDYQRILAEAYQKGGYASPQSYLKTLSAEQLATIQQVQHLADPIRVDQLSEEASLNLLIPPDAQVDSNHDGLTAVGAAYTLRFPDSTTPANVRDAWEEATAGMPEQDKMLFQMQIKMPLLLANMHFDKDGNYVRTSEPGDADWTNPMAAPSFSFSEAANNWLDYLDRFKYQMPADQYERDKKFWTSFQHHLSERE